VNIQLNLVLWYSNITVVARAIIPYMRGPSTKREFPAGFRAHDDCLGGTGNSHEFLDLPQQLEALSLQQ
jgi:hypothetical protein